MAEPIALDHLFQDTRAFLAELAASNSRAWFQTQKTRYDTLLKRPSEKLLAETAAWLEAETGEQPRTKLFRPYRDVRFSPDKTPYHTHLHMMWSLGDGRAWMLGIAPDYATVGAGIMAFGSAQADRFRAAVAGPEGETLAKLLDQGWRVDPPALKRVPAPYTADHPRAELLRHKGLVAWADDMDDALSRDAGAAVRDVMVRAQPLMDWLAANA